MRREKWEQLEKGAKISNEEHDDHHDHQSDRIEVGRKEEKQNRNRVE